MSTLERDQRGMTLMETMIASSVVGVGLVAVSAAIPAATYGVQEGRQLTTATFLASQRLEQVRAARWEAGPPAVDELGISTGPAAAPAAGAVVTFPDEPEMSGPYAGSAGSTTPGSRITREWGMGHHYFQSRGLLAIPAQKNSRRGAVRRARKRPHPLAVAELRD